VASTCSTSLVPMPNASAPNAPCVAVCESPHTIVSPGSVNPWITWFAGCRVQHDPKLPAIEGLDLFGAPNRELPVGCRIVIGHRERGSGSSRPFSPQMLDCGQAADRVQQCGTVRFCANDMGFPGIMSACHNKSFDPSPSLIHSMPGPVTAWRVELARVWPLASSFCPC
jgi:hypothetical protein